MKRTLLACLVVLLAAASSNAMAGWVRVNGNDKVVAYADPSTIRKKGNITKIGSLFDFKAENLYSEGNSYASIMRETEFNCKENLQRMISYSIYAGKMGKGKMVDSGAPPQDWKPVSKGSIATDMKTYACDFE